MRVLLAALLTLISIAGAKADPAMWEARDGDSRVVLFGSVHALPSDFDWRTPALDAAMVTSEHVYFETDVGPRGLLALTVKMTFAAFQSASAPWLHLLTQEEREQLGLALASLGMTVEQAGAMPPWLVSMQISSQMMSGSPTSAEYKFDAGVEWTLQWALDPERKAYFETPGEQFDLIASGTLDEQVQGLIAMLAETVDSGALDRLVDAWAKGDVDALAAMITAEGEAQEAAMEVLLHQRNRNWIPAIEKLLAENHEDLIVVGAAHLAGAGSVLDLLSEAGYTVTRIQ